MKSLLLFAIGALLSIGAAAISIEIYVRAYVYFSGTARSAHSDDYGMAFDAVLVAGSVFVITGIACYFFFRTRNR
jgi:hypothetical protein